MITFFTSPIGLGHATRDIAIALRLKNDITFVSGEGAASREGAASSAPTRTIVYGIRGQVELALWGDCR